MRSLSLLFTAAILTAPCAFAQDGFRLSFGGAVEPDYLGADTYSPSPFVSLSYRRGSLGIEGTPRSARLSWDTSQVFRVGALLRSRGGRGSVEDPAVDALADVPATVEAGMFFRANAGPIRISAEFAADVLGETNGVVAELGARLPLPLSERATLVPSIGLFGANDAFADAYFSVAQADVAASGLTRFDASGGLLGGTIGLSGRYQINDRVTAIGGVSYSRLTADAADSPIVADRGAPGQFRASVGLSIRF